MTLGDSIRHGTKWLLTGSMGGQVLQFAFGVVLARLLTPDDFGLLVTTQIFTGFVGMVASGGMGEALVQAKDVRDEDYQTVFTFQFAVGLLIYAGFFFIAPRFAVWFGHPIYENLLRVSALTFLLRPFANIPQIQLRRAMRFKEIALINFGIIILASSASIALAASGFGVWSLVISGLIGVPFSIALLSWRTPWRPRLHYDRESAKALSSYGFKSIANELLVYFRDQTANFIVTKVSGPMDVGLFNKASSLSRTPVGMVAGSAYQTVFRALSHVQDDLNQSRYIYFRTITLVSLYTLPIYLALAAVTKEFMVGMFGQQWGGAAEPLLILCAGAPIYHLEMISGALVAARNRLAEESSLQFQALLFYIVAGLIGIQFGLNGLAWATVAVSYFIGIRLTMLGLNSIQASMRDLLHALRPIVLLLGVETVMLLGTEAFFAEMHIVLHDQIYAVVVVMAGLGTYGLMFILAPSVTLVKEANRWRSKLRLSPLPARI